MSVTITRCDPPAGLYVAEGFNCYSVALDGTVIGHVYSRRRACERRSDGRRYVNARWDGARPEWGWKVLGGREWPGVTWDTRKGAVASLMDDHDFRRAKGGAS